MKLIYRGISYDRSASSTETATAVKVAPQTLLYRGLEYSTHPDRPAAAAVAFRAPVELIYRGTRYTVGQANVEQTQPVTQVEAVPTNQPVAYQPESLSELARELLITLRQKADRREQSVLSRFKSSIGINDSWTVYRHHDAAMS